MSRAEAHALILLIKKNLAQTSDWLDRNIMLTWWDYRLLLEYRGETWRPTDRSFDATHDDRPIKTFDGFPLICGPYSNPTSKVQGKRSDGMLVALAIPPR
jgi:hypothetical protein